MSKSEKRQTLLICTILVIVTFLAFEGVRHNDFVSFDDPVYVTENPHIVNGITWKSVVWAFTTITTPNVGVWHPLTRLSHMLDCELFGLNPSWHHLTSLWFHIANGLLLFWVLKKMTNAVWLSGFVAAVFAVHPLHVESVAWVTERRDLLSGFFMMLTIGAYIHYTERPCIKKYLPVFLFFALGLMSKSILVTLPCVLLLLDYWPLGRLQFKHQDQIEEELKTKAPDTRFRKPPTYLLIEKTPLFILTIIACIIAVLASKGGMSSLSNVSIKARIVNALNSYLGYIIKMVYPVHLAVLYPYPRVLRMDTAIITLMAIVILMVRYAPRRPWLTVGLLWYLSMFIPVIGIVQIGTQSMADRYTYLPLIGVTIVIAWAAAELAEKRQRLKFVFGASAVIILLALLIFTRLQVRYWRNSITLYEHALAVTKDNFTMHNNLASALAQEGRISEAVFHLTQALEISPKQPEINYNLGRLLLMQQKQADAVRLFRTAVRLDPNHLQSLQNLSWILATSTEAALRNPTEAVKLAQRACELTGYKNRRYIDTLAAAYAAAGRFTEAVETGQKAISLADPQVDKEIITQLKKRLQLYRSNQPYREGKIPASPENQ
jgi:Flp pilus assembly protein TadD